MKAVVQRVASASVCIDADTVASIGTGMLVLVGVMRGDGADEARRLAERIARFRFFPDEDGRMNRSALEGGLSALVVSQFTFAAAAPPEIAEPLYDAFVEAFRALGLSVETGRFGARMQVALVNDGPVTF